MIGDTYPMSHAVYRVTDFRYLGEYRLELTFDDGLKQTIDFNEVLLGPMYGPLRDVNEFRKVGIDDVAHTLVWPNGADFDPETLHDWPRYHQTMRDTLALASGSIDG